MVRPITYGDHNDNASRLHDTVIHRTVLPINIMAAI